MRLVFLWTVDHTHPQFPLSVATLEDVDGLFNINFRAAFLSYKYAAKQMIAQGRGGRIIGVLGQDSQIRLRTDVMIQVLLQLLLRRVYFLSFFFRAVVDHYYRLPLHEHLLRD